MTALRFVVDGKPVGVNETHVGGARPFVKSPEARAFAAKVASRGMAARRCAGWATTSLPVEVEIRIFFANERPDTDGPVKAILDALQSSNPKQNRLGAGIIENDRQVKRFLVECCDLARKSTNGTPSSLAWFVGWLQRLPMPEVA